MCQNKRKGQIIRTLIRKWKVKGHYMKRDDGISTTNKEHNNALFFFPSNKFLLFSISRMNAKKSFVEKLKNKCRKNYEN
jgi:hypothetical protein